MQNEMEEDLKSSVISQNGSDMIKELSSETSTELWLFLQTTALTFFGIFGTFLCSSVFAMYTDKKSLRTPANVFVLSLTVSDFLRASFLLPLCILRIEGSLSGKLFCKIFNFLSLWINITSVLSIMSLAIDRNKAVKDPFHYVKHSSKKQAAFLVICIWMLSLVFALPILFGFPELENKCCDIKISATESMLDPVLIYELIVTVMAFLIPFFTVTCLYYRMYKAAKNNTARCERSSYSSYGSSDVVLNKRTPTSSEDNENNLRRHTYIRDEHNHQQSNRFLKKHRAALTGILAVVSLFVCFTPYFILRFCQKFTVMTIEMNFWGYFPTFISTIINPYIYFYRNHSTKKFAAQFFRKKTSNYLPQMIRNRIVNISDLYRISYRRTQTVAASQPAETITLDNLFQTEPKQLHKQDLQRSTDDLPMSTKQLLHHDSTSSNLRSDICSTSASFDSDEIMRYQTLKEKYSEESSSEENH